MVSDSVGSKRSTRRVLVEDEERVALKPMHYVETKPLNYRKAFAICTSGHTPKQIDQTSVSEIAVHLIRCCSKSKAFGASTGTEMHRMHHGFSSPTFCSRRSGEGYCAGTMQLVKECLLFSAHRPFVGCINMKIGSKSLTTLSRG